MFVDCEYLAVALSLIIFCFVLPALCRCCKRRCSCCCGDEEDHTQTSKNKRPHKVSDDDDDDSYDSLEGDNEAQKFTYKDKPITLSSSSNGPRNAKATKNPFKALKNKIMSKSGIGKQKGSQWSRLPAASSYVMGGDDQLTLKDHIDDDDDGGQEMTAVTVDKSSCSQKNGHHYPFQTNVKHTHVEDF